MHAERDEWGSLAPPIYAAPPELSRLQRWGSGRVVRKIWRWRYHRDPGGKLCIIYPATSKQVDLADANRKWVLTEQFSG